jgi:lysozyme
MEKRSRMQVAAAFAVAIAGGGVLLTFTPTHEGTGPVETIPVETAKARGVIGPEAAWNGFHRLAREQVAVTHAYADPGYGWRVPTICYGHTRGVTRGMTATLEQCEKWLAEDFETLVKPALMRCVHVPVSVNEAAALADFVFNVGGSKFCGSALARKLNAGDYRGAADEFQNWKYSNKKIMPGLVKRRAAEKALFLEE